MAYAVVVEVIVAFRRRRRFQRVARQWDMHYSAGDRLGLAHRLADRLPTPGPANIRVRDLLFCAQGERHRYVFSVEYGVGVVHGKNARRLVAGFEEPITRGTGRAKPPTLIVAPHHLVQGAAYDYVLHALAQTPAGV